MQKRIELSLSFEELELALKAIEYYRYRDRDTYWREDFMGLYHRLVNIWGENAGVEE